MSQDGSGQVLYYHPFLAEMKMDPFATNPQRELIRRLVDQCPNMTASFARRMINELFQHIEDTNPQPERGGMKDFNDRVVKPRIDRDED